MNLIASAITQAIQDIEPFSRLILKRPLRDYQLEPARAAIHSVIARDGEQYLWRFPRQSGKNETLAHVHLYLLFLFQRVKGASIVHTAPTFDPQAKNAIQRIVEITTGNPFFHKLQVSANIVSFGKARALFLSGQERDRPNVGSTASLLLSKDECQDLSQAYVERAFDPMTANTNAPHIHTGTARHDGTYLALKRKELEELQKQDGRKRIFVINWRDVARTNPAYGQAVQAAILRKGAQHPAILTEYENVETAQTGRLFDSRRIALIFNPATPAHTAPMQDARYVVTIDVGGTDLNDSLVSQRDGSASHDHDMTVATVHQVTATSGSASLNLLSTVDQLTISGQNVLDDTPARQRLFAYIGLWQPLRIVVDSTGLGVGLASALINHYGSKVTPFQFTAATKTQLLNDWLALIETGRYKHYRDDSIDCQRFIRQLEKCEHQYRGNLIQWGIPAHVTWRHPVTLQDEPIHDDHLISAALVAIIADSNLQPREITSVQPSRNAVTRRNRQDD